MSTTPLLTRAARRDLKALLAGERPDLRFGPYKQLLDAGLITGEQPSYELTEAARQLMQSATRAD